MKVWTNVDTSNKNRPWNYTPTARNAAVKPPSPERMTLGTGLSVVLRCNAFDDPVVKSLRRLKRRFEKCPSARATLFYRLSRACRTCFVISSFACRLFALTFMGAARVRWGGWWPAWWSNSFVQCFGKDSRAVTLMRHGCFGSYLKAVHGTPTADRVYGDIESTLLGSDDLSRLVYLYK